MVYSLTPTLISHYAFQNDRPELPIETITVPLNGLERRITGGQIDLIDRAINELLIQAGPLIESGNLSGVMALESSVGTALQQPIYDAWASGYQLGSQHGIAAMQAVAPQLDILFSPLTLTNNPAEQAVLQRSIQLAGNYSSRIIDRLKQDLIASIQPQGDGSPINRRELRSRIAATLNVAEAQAEAIARTESTAAYNRGRLDTYSLSNAVDGIRFLAITDNRTTEICRSRNGLIWRMNDPAISANTPPLHVRCRSVLSPVLGAYNERHAQMLADPARNPANAQLVALPEGWIT